MQILKSNDRGHTEISWLKSYHSFSFGDYYDPDHVQFKSLRVINEDFIAPSSGFGTHPHRNMEIVTYVVSGTLTHKDSLGTEQELKAGEVQRMTAGRGVFHSEWNASPDTPVHLLQMWLLPERQGLEPSYEQRLIPKAGALTTLVAKNTPGALHINQDAEISLLSLEASQSVQKELAPGYGIWLQLISGSVDVDGAQIKAGDAVALENQELVRIKALEAASGILFTIR